MSKHFETIYDSKKLLTLLSERGETYAENAVAGVFRGRIYVRVGKAKDVDIFNLPLPMVAEVENFLPVEMTPFSAKFKPGPEIPRTQTEATEIITNHEVFKYQNILAVHPAVPGFETDENIHF